MCGRYKRTIDKQEIAEFFHVNGSITELPIVPEDDVRPTTVQPILRQNRDTGERDLVMARWGFVPGWHKPDERFPPTTFNARSEGIEKAGMWKRAFATHRCLVPADSFYEWVRPESRSCDCPAWSRDRTCRPIGSTLGGQAER